MRVLRNMPGEVKASKKNEFSPKKPDGKIVGLTASMNIYNISLPYQFSIGYFVPAYYLISSFIKLSISLHSFIPSSYFHSRHLFNHLFIHLFNHSKFFRLLFTQIR